MLLKIIFHLHAAYKLCFIVTLYVLYSIISWSELMFRIIDNKTNLQTFDKLFHSKRYWEYHKIKIHFFSYVNKIWPIQTIWKICEFTFYYISNFVSLLSDIMYLLFNVRQFIFISILLVLTSCCSINVYQYNLIKTEVYMYTDSPEFTCHKNPRKNQKLRANVMVISANVMHRGRHEFPLLSHLVYREQ